MFAFLLHADPGLSHVVTANVSGSTMTDWIRTLVPIRFTNAETQDNIRDLLNRVDETRAERNAFVHGIWTAGPEPGTAFVSTIRWDRREIMTNRLVGADDLSGLLEGIREVYDELVWLGRKAGFYTMPSTAT